MDRAIEAKANEVLGKTPEEPAPAEPSPAEPAPAEPAPAEPAPAEPAPAEPAPAEPAPAVEPSEPPTRAPAAPAAQAKEPVAAPKPKPQEPKPTKPSASAQPKPLEIAKPVDPPKPAEPAKAAGPVKPAEPEKPAKPATKVTVPQSKHVQVSMPARVQELLNADPRMQPWLNSTMATIEACYAQVRSENKSAAGTITFVLEMHDSARPDADITSLPPQLSGVVACGTGKLMRAARMPLFTGKEGEKHTVRVKFSQ